MWTIEVCAECGALVEYDGEYGGPFPANTAKDEARCLRDCAQLFGVRRPATKKVRVEEVASVVLDDALG